MRITGWRVDGFGVLHDHQVDDLPAGLVVVVGPNESGKTTLHDFVRGMLFGFPTGNTRARRHPPLNGGTAGGRLLLGIDADGVWTVRRFHRRLSILGPDGQPRTPEDLARMLGQLDERTFRAVHAVDPDELRGLDPTVVRERMLDASTTGAGPDPRAALAHLIVERDELFAPSGRRSRSLMVELAARLAELDRSLAEAVAQAQERATSLAADAGLRTQIADLDARLRRLDEASAELRARRTSQPPGSAPTPAGHGHPRLVRYGLAGSAAVLLTVAAAGVVVGKPAVALVGLVLAAGAGLGAWAARVSAPAPAPTPALGGPAAADLLARLDDERHRQGLERDAAVGRLALSQQQRAAAEWDEEVARLAAERAGVREHLVVATRRWRGRG
ncbi:MAG: AAA family ATPase, partial [Actinomycetes bacterium]